MKRPTIVRRPFGTAQDGTPVDLYTLATASGFEADVITYGASLHRMRCPDGTNVVLGFATLDGYTENDNHYFGATVGRFANRIANARFTLDGFTYRLAANDGPNSLHSGPEGFDRQVWDASVDGASLTLRYTSADGEMGFPGTLAAEVTYTLAIDGSLRIDYQATADAATVVNLTNHTLWNLGGEGSGSILDHVLELDAHRYTPVNTERLPTGEIAPVAGTPLDFTAPLRIGERIEGDCPELTASHGYDHNFVVDRDEEGALVRAARVLEPRSGRSLEVYTTEPGIQFYTGNFLDGTLVGTSGRAYDPRHGFALETQHFPDSPNRPEFPSTVLRPGEVFRSTTIFRLATASR